MSSKVLVFENELSAINYKARKPTIGPELELTNQFVSSSIQNYKSKTYNLALFIEPKIASGYPDVVMVEYHPKLLDSWVEERKTLRPNELSLLSILNSKKIVSFQKIIDSTHLNQKEAIGSLEKLLDCKMIERKSGKWSLINPSELFTIKKISAIEAKINNWQTALMQATMNIAYANESFILSNVKNPKDSTIHMLQEYGIGIYNIHQNHAQIVSKAKNFPMANNKTVWQFNEWIGRKLSENVGY